MKQILLMFGLLFWITVEHGFAQNTNLATPMLSNRQSTGEIKAVEMIRQSDILVQTSNGLCQVTGFTMYWTRKKCDPVELHSTSGKFEGKVLEAIKKAAPGDIFSFIEIQADCSNSGGTSNPSISSMIFHIL
ncbi:MAG: hypothetical protein MK212_20770 [Saprospiraceae bacterium]|nr:hypothetical protein [Saprospiraceae bacterium]